MRSATPAGPSFKYFSLFVRDYKWLTTSHTHTIAEDLHQYKLLEGQDTSIRVLLWIGKMSLFLCSEGMQ